MNNYKLFQAGKSLVTAMQHSLTAGITGLGPVKFYLAAPTHADPEDPKRQSSVPSGMDRSFARKYDFFALGLFEWNNIVRLGFNSKLGYGSAIIRIQTSDNGSVSLRRVPSVGCGSWNINAWSLPSSI